jgi:hypothetical protein
VQVTIEQGVSNSAKHKCVHHVRRRYLTGTTQEKESTRERVAKHKGRSSTAQRKQQESIREGAAKHKGRSRLHKESSRRAQGKEQRSAREGAAKQPSPASQVADR